MLEGVKVLSSVSLYFCKMSYNVTVETCWRGSPDFGFFFNFEYDNKWLDFIVTLHCVHACAVGKIHYLGPDGQLP